MELTAGFREVHHVLLHALRFLRDGPGEGSLAGDALKLDPYPLAIRYQAEGPRNVHAQFHDGPALLQLALRLGGGHVFSIELHHAFAALMVVADGGVAVAAHLIVVHVDQLGLGLAEHVLDMRHELPESMGPGQGAERLGQPAVMPLMVSAAARCVETLPEFVAQFVVITGNGAHVRKLVAHGDDLGVPGRLGDAVDGGLLAIAPAVRLADPFHELVTFLFHERSDTLAELAAQLIQRDGSVLHHIVQGGGGQQFLIGRDGRHDGDGLHRMDNIGESFTAALGILVRPDCEADGLVEQGAVHELVCHYILCILLILV